MLDDATSAVDPEVEARILAALREGGSDATLVVVAYRQATIALAAEVARSREADPAKMAAEKRLFGFSISYLFLLFGMLVADRWIMA